MLSLDDCLSYRNPRIISKFLVSFDLTKEEADDVFVELLKWLWLCAKAQKDREQEVPGVPRLLNIQSGLVIVDELWHIFILHTRDYAAFCEQYLGAFLHHSPATPDFQPPTQLETEVQMYYIYHNLGGSEALKKWYVDYAEQYPLDRIKQLRNDPLSYLDRQGALV